MSETNHPWCRDVARDEAIRAAEDAAAAERTPLPDHRDLPAAVAELRERVARLEAVIPKSVSVSNAEAHENKGDTMPAVGLRTERVTLEFQVEGSPPNQWPWSYIISRSDAIKMRPGEFVRVVEETHFDDLAQVAMERDAAREECERLRARVAELEAAPAANAGGEQPQPPRGWLTSEERRALEWFGGTKGSCTSDEWHQYRVEIRKLLARSTPPRVRRPMPWHFHTDEAEDEGNQAARDRQWEDAIREAGGEVE